MSIINDALKKTQNELEKKDDKNLSRIYEKLYKPKNFSEPPSPASLDEESAKPKKSKLRIFLVILSILIVAGAVALLIYLKPWDKSRAGIARRVTFSLFQPARPAKRGYSDKIVLSGIVVIDKKRVALLNDEIYYVGDYVNGKKVLSISLQKVQLQSKNGKVETLTVRHR